MPTKEYPNSVPPIDRLNKNKPYSKVCGDPAIGFRQGDRLFDKFGVAVRKTPPRFKAVRKTVVKSQEERDAKNKEKSYPAGLTERERNLYDIHRRPNMDRHIMHDILRENHQALRAERECPLV